MKKTNSTATWKPEQKPVSLGEGMTAWLEGDNLHIVINTTAPGVPSASGKSETVATTRGNRAIGVNNFVLGINGYRPMGR